MTNFETIKARQVQQWNGAAPNWERQNERRERVWRPVSEWICRAAALAPGMEVLDLACGTGQPALTAAVLVGPNGRVVATDLSQGMVELTARRAQQEVVTNIDCRIADAEALDFPDVSFDAVTMQFGLMFCPEPDRAVSEIYRVLRPGGRCAVSIWDELSKSPGQTILDQAVANAGMSVRQSTWEAGPLARLAVPGVLQGIFSAAGFAKLDVATISITWDYDSTEHYWREQLASTQLKPLLEANSAQDIERLKSALLELLQNYQTNMGVSLPVTSLCAVGLK